MVIQAGITEVVAPRNDNPRWQEDFKLTRAMFDEACVKLRLLDQESPPKFVSADDGSGDIIAEDGARYSTTDGVTWSLVKP
jgi:hypothetical protein